MVAGLEDGLGVVVVAAECRPIDAQAPSVEELFIGAGTVISTGELISARLITLGDSGKEWK